QDVPLRTFMKYRTRIMNRVVRNEGRGWPALWRECGDCKGAEPTFRCRDSECMGGQMYCLACLLKRHASLPLHWIEASEKNLSLDALITYGDAGGMRVQLGHPGGTSCTFRSAAHVDFAVIHTNGIHRVALDYCGCGEPPEDALDQLLDQYWWPATPLEPQTCCTFAALRQFHTLNTTGKVSGYDYYRTLEQLTDNTGLVKLLDRRRPFMRIVREWRNVKMYIRMGRAHDPSGIEGTEDGELAQFCHACPQLGKNMPEDWRDEPAKTAFKYWVHAGGDANFRLRGRMVSSDAKDPTLSDGKAYFCNKVLYTEHIKKYVNQEEISTCSGFAAMFLANLKRVKGLRTSGVAGVTCTRHNMWRPCGMGDLQKGERFCNMDWVICWAMRRCEDLKIVFTYDIACQYYKLFWDRLTKLPDYLHLNLDPDGWRWYVPNFHLPPHKDDCHAPFSLHFAPGVGLTNGEGIEQNWENSNGAANQTKQMGPGSRQDTLDDILSPQNDKLQHTFTRYSPRRLVDAIREAVRQRKGFDAFDAGLESASPGITMTWAEEEATWQAEKSKPCPYRVTNKGKTMKDVELELAKEEFEETASLVQVVHESTRSMRILELDVKAKKAATTYQEIDFQRRRNAIQRKLERFRELQNIYMPALRDELSVDQQVLLTANAKKEVETVKLFLPSALTEDKSRDRACAPGIASIESRLRFAEASDALEELRHGLRMRTVTNQFKVKNVTGQRANTRAQGIQHGVDVRIHTAKLRYRYAREAYARLVGAGTWEGILRVLDDEDSGGVAAAGVVVQGEGRRTLSWIWYGGYLTDAESAEEQAAAVEALRAEWCKGRARAMRWYEEVIILEEEMRRSIASAEWVCEAWKRRAVWRAEESEMQGDALTAELREGLQGYALEHAETARRRAEDLREAWADVREAARVVVEELDGSGVVDEAVLRELPVVDGEEDEGESGMYEELDN
ncbi:hypothetical protein DFH06DRAFT_1021347, partial [Mycena polygramma]